jgi:hypothetical protein
MSIRRLGAERARPAPGRRAGPQWQTALFLPVNGRSTLVVDVAPRQEPEPVADYIEFSEDL